MVIPSDEIDAGGAITPELLNPTARTYQQCEELVKACSRPRFYIGYDVARAPKGDKAAIDISVDIGGELVPFYDDQFAGVKFKDQKELLRNYILKYRPVKVAIDASSIGWNLAEDLQDEFPKVVEQVKFNSKHQVTKVIGMFITSLKDQVIITQDTQSFRDSTECIRQTVDDEENITYWIYRSKSGEEGQIHGDAAIAKALSNYAWCKGRGEEPVEKASDLLTELESLSIDLEYSSVIEDKFV